MPVSLFGQCADMDAINEIAIDHKLSVIENAFQSFGATYNGKKSCNLSTIGCTSFSPSNPLGAYGEGGVIFTNDDEIAEKVKTILSQGIFTQIDTFEATVLNVKLKYFEKDVTERDYIGSRYSDLLEDIPT